MGAQHLRRVPTGPLPCAQQSFALAGTPRGHQHQCHGNISGGISYSAGRVRHRDASRPRRSHVNVVIADTKVGKYLGTQVWDIGKDIGAEKITQCRQDRIVIPQSRTQFIR